MRTENRLANIISEREIYLSYRVAKGQDDHLAWNLDWATSIYAELSTPYRSYGVGETYVLAWLRDGQGFVDRANQLVVLQVASSNSFGQIVLCRYTSTPAECGSFQEFTETSRVVSGSQAQAAPANALLDDVRENINITNAPRR